MLLAFTQGNKDVTTHWKSWNLLWCFSSKQQCDYTHTHTIMLKKQTPFAVSQHYSFSSLHPQQSIRMHYFVFPWLISGWADVLSHVAYVCIHQDEKPQGFCLQAAEDSRRWDVWELSSPRPHCVISSWTTHLDMILPLYHLLIGEKNTSGSSQMDILYVLAYSISIRHVLLCRRIIQVFHLFLKVRLSTIVIARRCCTLHEFTLSYTVQLHIYVSLFPQTAPQCFCRQVYYCMYLE